jgi:hypothetical protein
MGYLRTHGWPIGLALGVMVGLMIGGIWPNTPLHAVATASADSHAMATGFVAEGIEAVYYLDFLTGSLKAAVLSNQNPGFQAFYESNIHADMAQAMATSGMQMPQTPKYMMVTGLNDIRRMGGQRTKPSSAALYVAEANTGFVLAYILPWSSESHSSNQIYNGTLTVWAYGPFSSAMIRTQ